MVLQHFRVSETFSSTSYTPVCVYVQWTASGKLNLIVEIVRKISLRSENVWCMMSKRAFNVIYLQHIYTHNIIIDAVQEENLTIFIFHSRENKCLWQFIFVGRERIGRNGKSLRKLKWGDGLWIVFLIPQDKQLKLKSCVFTITWLISVRIFPRKIHFLFTKIWSFKMLKIFNKLQEMCCKYFN